MQLEAENTWDKMEEDIDGTPSFPNLKLATSEFMKHKPSSPNWNIDEKKSQPIRIKVEKIDESPSGGEVVHSSSLKIIGVGKLKLV